MAKRGRPVKGTQLLQGVDASAAARQRLTIILQTLAGALTIHQACQVLGVNRSRFHDLRQQFLAQATGLLEPRVPGPRPRTPTPAELQILRLRRQIVQLKLDLKAAQVREELALVMPQLFSKKRGPDAAKKKRGAKRRAKTRAAAPAHRRSDGRRGSTS